MKRIKKQPIVLVFLSIFAFLSTNDTGKADPSDPRLKKVFADWEKRQNSFKSVRYRVTGERITTPNFIFQIDDKGKETKQETKINKEISCPKKFLMVLDFDKSRHRLEVRQQFYDFEKKVFYPRVSIEVFDGKLLKTFIPRAENTSEFHSRLPGQPDIVEQNGGLYNFLPDYWPILVGHGIIPTVHRPISPGMLNAKPEEEFFYVQGQGSYAQRNCLVVRTHAIRHTAASFSEFWVDEGRDSAVIRFVNHYDGRPASSMDIDYQKKNRRWIPFQWTWVARDKKGKTEFFDRMRVEEFIATPPLTDEDFDFEVRPGMIVSKTKIEEPSTQKSMAERINEETFQVNNNGKFVLISTRNEGKTWSLYLWWGFPLVLFMSIGAWLLYRQKRGLNRRL